MYRKNTAGQFICVQLLLTATGAVATGLSPAARRCIDGTFAAGGGTFTEDGTTGSYKYALAQADTNGNDISIIVTATGAIPVCVNFVTTAGDPTDAVHFGLTCLPNTAVTTNASLLTSGTGTDQLSVTSGRIDVGKLLGTAWLTPGVAGTPDVNTKLVGGQTASASGTVTFPNATLASTTNITAGTITTVTNLTNAATSGDLTATMKASLATAVWTDTTAGDFTTALSVGKSVMNGVTLGTGLTVNILTNLPSIPANWLTATGINAAALNGKGDWNTTTPPTAGAIATGVWQDTTAGDFTAANSIGKSVMNGVALGSGLHTALVDTVTTYTGNTPQTGDNFARIGTPAGASVSADIAAAKVDTAAIKVQTDKLAFTSANKVDSNVLSVNSHAVTGDGHAGTEWGPA